MLIPRLLFAAALVLAAAPAEAAGPNVSQAWSRPAAAGTNGVGFLTLTNTGAADTLVGAESPVARKIEIHRSSMKGGVMSMQRETTIPLPAGAAVTFAPGGRHLMLIGLTRPLKVGEKAPVTLIFARAGRVKAELTVGIAGPAPAMDHSAMHH